MGTLAHLGHTLYDPLLPPRLRARLESNLAHKHRENADRIHIFLAGLTAECIQTLPTSDHWRRLSARCATITVGDNPPTPTAQPPTANHSAPGATQST